MKHNNTAFDTANCKFKKFYLQICEWTYRSYEN